MRRRIPRRGLPVQDLSGSLMEPGLDGAELVVGDHGQVAALRPVLAQKAVCLLVGAAQPRAGRMSEVDAVGEEPGQQIMSGHLTALIPGQGQPGVRRELLEHPCGRGGERLGCMASGQADQSQTAAGAGDEGADRRASRGRRANLPSATLSGGSPPRSARHRCPVLRVIPTRAARLDRANPIHDQLPVGIPDRTLPLPPPRPTSTSHDLEECCEKFWNPHAVRGVNFRLPLTEAVCNPRMAGQH